MYNYDNMKNIVNKGVGTVKPNFKIGEEVIVNNLVFDKRSNRVNAEMMCYQGMKAKIMNILWDSYDLSFYYLLDIDGGVNKYCYYMLSKVD